MCAAGPVNRDRLRGSGAIAKKFRMTRPDRFRSGRAVRARADYFFSVLAFVLHNAGRPRGIHAGFFLACLPPRDVNDSVLWRDGQGMG
jgi:hypothetical protein